MRSNVVSSLASEIWLLLKSSWCVLLCRKRGPVDQALQQPTAVDAWVPIEAGTAQADPDPDSDPAPSRTPAPVPAAAPIEEEAAPAPAPYEVLQLVTLSLDSGAKSAWRLVSKATCHAVYESTTGLSISWGDRSITALPLPLLGKCGGLRQLVCSGATELKSIHGLPHNLEVLKINMAITDFSPLRHCSGLRQLSVCIWAYSCNHPAAPPACTLHTVDGWTALRAALQCMPGLQRLGLCFCQGWSVKAMQILAPALEMLTGLQHLRITALSSGGKPAIGEEGARALASALAPLTKLQHLDLSSLGLNAAEASVLAPSLGCLTGLRTLNLSYNSLGPEGALALAPALAGLTALQHLHLGKNGFGPDGCRLLAPALQALSSLQVLDLSWNYIGDEAAQVLAPIMRTITSLRWLGFGMNRMTDACKALAPLMNVAGLVVRIGVQFDEDG